MGLQFLFMDDNAPCHCTVAAEQLLESEDIERMDWPARSPYLNPIEHEESLECRNPHDHTNRSVSSSECGPVCDLKTVAEVSKNGRCYPITSIRSTKSHNPSPRPISVNKCATSEGSTARGLGSALTVATGIRISRQTVYRRLNHAGLYARRPAVCIPLTSAHKRARLNWSLKHQH
ncbi:transposable element Tcb2 transposase [Trichonephila clavipes]|nr:transposable element Tcb2 transposase [Trichonephila clavipes]